MKKRLLALLSATVIAGVFVGCGSGSNNVNQQDTSENAQTTGTQNSTEQSSAKTTMDTLDIFINMSWYPVSKFEGIIPDIIKSKTGVDLNVTIATDSNQLGVMIGSGELPDLVFTDTELDRLSNPDICISYNELESKYGANFSEAEPTRKTIATLLSADDNYYTMLQDYSPSSEWKNLKVGAPGQACIYYRKDLLKQLGDPEIESVDDLNTVLEQCKEKFPDMIPMGLGGVWKFNALENMMGATQSSYDPSTGEYRYITSAPKYKDFLKECNYLARKGLVSPEQYANTNESDASAQAYNNGCVFWNAFLSYSDFLGLQAETSKITPNAEWGVLPYFGEDGMGTGKGWAGAFVSKNCKNPEAAARFLSYLNSKEGDHTAMWGREGTDYTLGEDGVPNFSDEFLAARADSTLLEKWNWRFNFGSSALTETYLNYAGVEADILKDFTTWGKNFKSYPEVGAAQPLSSSDEGVIYSKLEELRKNYEAKIIFTNSDEEFENAYQELQDAAKKIGVDAYNEYMTGAIRTAKSTIEGK